MNPAVIVLLGSFVVMLLLKVPIAFSLGLSTLFTALYLDLTPVVVFQQMVRGVNSFSLMAIPFFILAGEIMGQGGISDRLVKFANLLVGWMRGGLAMVNCLDSMLFGGISGSAVADVASLGKIMVPMMEKSGYDKDFAVSITAASSIQAILIPPSHNMIIYAMAAGGGISVARLFLAGIVPGVLLGVTFMILCYYLSVKRNYPKGERVSFGEAWRITRDSLLGLMTAVIILGGVTTGIFTASESAAVAAVYAFIITFFVYRDIPLRQMGSILVNSLKTLSTVLAIIATSAGFAWMMAYLQIPQMATNALLGISSHPVAVLLMVNFILLVLGCIMDMAPLILIATPILLPVVTKVGMSPITFGVMMMLNLGIGLLTPPVGSVLFVSCSVGGISVERLTKAIFPFYIAMIIVLLLITFVPSISLAVPNWLMG